MIKKIILNDEIKQQINETGNIPTKLIMQYLIDNVQGTQTNKPINKTSLSELTFDGKLCTYAKYDLWTNELILHF